MKIAVLEDSDFDYEKLINAITAYKNTKDHIIIETQRFVSGEECLKSNLYFDENGPDAFFIDIKMDTMDGIETARELRKRGYIGEIIFLTAYKQFVFSGYEVRAMNYLLKPVDSKLLYKCLDEIGNNKLRKHLVIGTKEGAVSIPYAKILTISSRSHYVDILTIDSITHEFKIGINNIEQLLPDTFVRTHRSYIVNIAHIIKISKEEIESSNHLKARVSKTYFRDVMKKYMDFVDKEVKTR